MYEKEKEECLECSEFLKKYGIKDIKQIEKISNLAEYLKEKAKENPEKYGKYEGKEYQENETLKKIFAIIDDKQKLEIFINLNKEKDSNLPYGDLAKRDTVKGKMEFSPKVKVEMEKQMEKMGADSFFGEKEKDKMLENIQKEDVESLEKMAKLGINGRVKMELEAKVIEKRWRNKTKAARKKSKYVRKRYKRKKQITRRYSKSNGKGKCNSNCNLLLSRST